jgi:hypothetical protein
MGVPRTRFLGVNADGRVHTPFWVPTQSSGSEEIAKAEELLEWWWNLQPELASKRGTVHDLGAIVNKSGPSRREHRLIKDMTPATQPSGYFDCTVEVGTLPFITQCRCSLS